MNFVWLLCFIYEFENEIPIIKWLVVYSLENIFVIIGVNVIFYLIYRLFHEEKMI